MLVCLCVRAMLLVRLNPNATGQIFLSKTLHGAMMMAVEVIHSAIVISCCLFVSVCFVFVCLCVQAPHCLQEEDLEGALKMALSSPLEDVRKNASLTSDHIDTLKKLNGLVYQGRDIYEEVKSVSYK